MKSAQNGTVFRVGPELAVVFKSGSLRYEASLTGVSHPFHEFVARGQLPPSIEKCLFTITFSHLPLVYGRCDVQSETSGRVRAYDIELDPPLSKDTLAPRLGPFIRGEDYLRYQNLSPEPKTEKREPTLGQLYQLVSLIGEINSAQESQVLLFKIIDAAAQIMDAEAASLMLADGITGELVVAIPTGPASAEISGIRIPPGQGIAGWVAEQGEPVAVSDVTGDSRFFGDISDSSFSTRDLVAVPLHTSDGRIIGVLEAINKSRPDRFTEEDIPLLAVLADHAALALEKERLTRAAIEQELLEQELALAAQIQEGFWPKSIPQFEGFGMAGLSLAAKHVGGDYYDFIPLDENRLAVVVADVSGKGVSAALVMSALRSSLRAHLKRAPSIETCVAEVNTAIAEDTPSNRFITLFLAVLDRRLENIRYVNAGHNAPVMLSPNQTVTRLEAGGPILGFRAGIPYELGTAEMKAGSILVMFSDGVSEAQNPAEEFYGEERLIESVKVIQDLSANEVLESLNADLESYMDDAPQYDDLTLVVVKATPRNP